MHLLCDREEIGCALNHTPLGVKTEIVHKQSKRGNRLSDAPSVIGRIKIGDAQTFELSCFLANAFDILRTDKRLVIFNLCDAILRHFLKDSFSAADTLANCASGD